MTTTVDVSQLVARLERIERQQQGLRRFAWGALCLLPLGLGAFVSGGADPVVRAQQLELLNQTGGRQAVLSADSSGAMLTLLGARGQPVSAVRLGDSALTLLDAGGQPVATLGGPQVRHLAE